VLSIPQALAPTSTAVEQQLQSLGAPSTHSARTTFTACESTLSDDDAELYHLVSQEHDCDEEFYDKMVRSLVLQGKLNEALEIADNYMPDGAPDFLINLLIAQAEDKSTTWPLVMRLRDKEIAAQFVFTWLESWDDIEVCIDLLFMLKSHLHDGSETRQRTNELYDEMRLFRDVLRVDHSWKAKWQPLAGVCRRSPAQAVRNLTQLRQHQLARTLARQFSVPNVKREIEENHLLELLEKHQDTNEATKALIALDDEAVPVAEALMEKVQQDSLKLFLVQYLISHLSRPTLANVVVTSSSATSATLLNTTPGAPASTAGTAAAAMAAGSINSLESLRAMEKGIRAVMALPESLQALYRPLIRRPDLIVHNLIMTEQITQTEKLFQVLPELRDDMMLVFYAKKAIRFERKATIDPMSSPAESASRDSSSESLSSAAAAASSASSPFDRRATISQSVSSSSGSSITSWMKRRTIAVEEQYSRSMRTPSASRTSNTPRASDPSARANTLFIDSDPSLAGETPGDSSSATASASSSSSTSTSALTPTPSGSPPSLLKSSGNSSGSLLPLTGDDERDNIKMNEFSFVAAPSINLLKSLLDMCADSQNAGVACWDLCDQLSERLNRETEDRLFLTNLMHQLLLYGRLQFIKSPDGSNRAAMCDTLLGHVDLLQSLVISKCPIPVRLMDFSDPHKLKLLRDELIRDDRVRMALEVGTKVSCRVSQLRMLVIWLDQTDWTM
jgi:hypothetical protein